MARIGILNCSNCTGETNCAAVVCLGDMRKRRGLFKRYSGEKSLDLIEIISCAGCPTLAAPDKILKRVRALTEFRLDALHFSYCMTALCPFLKTYEEVVKNACPELDIVLGTHTPSDKKEFRRGVRELLCPTVSKHQSMNDIVRGTIELPDGDLNLLYRPNPFLCKKKSIFSIHK